MYKTYTYGILYAAEMPHSENIAKLAISSLTMVPYVCVMNCSIDIVHVRWHTRQHSTIQNQDISLIRQFTILRRLLVSFCLVPILGGARLVLCLRSGPLESIIMETYVNRITLISVYVADHNCCMIIYTQFSKTRR